MTSQQPESNADFFDSLPDATPKDEEAFALMNKLLAGRVHLLEERVEEEKQRNKHRFKFALIFVGIAALWLLATVTIVLIHGFSVFGFNLDDKVLMALLGTGTVNVLAPAYLVAKYLFAPRGADDRSLGWVDG